MGEQTKIVSRFAFFSCRIFLKHGSIKEDGNRMIYQVKRFLPTFFCRRQFVLFLCSVFLPSGKRALFLFTPIVHFLKRNKLSNNGSNLLFI